MVPKEFDVEGKAIILTGGARGIGKGIARVLAEAGANVLVTALTNNHLGPLTEELAAAGHPIEPMMADATKGKDMDRTISRAIELWGRIDVLMNNVGDLLIKPLVPLPGSSNDDFTSEEEWRYMVDINMTQGFLGCRAVGPHMLSRRQGKVINVTSVAGSRALPNRIGYGSAKAGLAHMTRIMALEWAPYGVTVNTLCPGLFPDPETGTPQPIEIMRELAREQVPLGRPGELREIGLLALYMCSSATDFMTGSTIYIDGGSSAS